MLIVFKEEVRKDWIDDDDKSTHCDLLREPVDESNQAIHPSAEKDCCHTQLLMHVKEQFIISLKHLH